MADFSAKDVQRLRQLSGAGMMDAKKALVETEGDFEAAGRWLREKGLASSAKRSERANAQGAVAVVRSGNVAAVVELKCETDFVAKSPDFVGLVDELARAVAEEGEQAAQSRQSAVDDLKLVMKENLELGRVVRLEAGEGNALDAYLHSQSGRGVNAVVVELTGGSQELAHDVAVHAAFGRPQYVRREEVPPELVAEERATFEATARNAGKPESALAKIVDGMMNGWFKERVLLEQAFAKDEKQSISQVLGDARIERFAQVVIGS